MCAHQILWWVCFTGLAWQDARTCTISLPLFVLWCALGLLCASWWYACIVLLCALPLRPWAQWADIVGLSIVVSRFPTEDWGWLFLAWGTLSLVGHRCWKSPLPFFPVLWLGTLVVMLARMG